MTLDPRWLEILKASGWQTAAIAVAGGAFLLIARLGWMPPLAPWMIQLAWAVLLFSSLLAIASLINATFTFLQPKRWILHWIGIRRERRAAEAYVSQMTDRERQILGYLLEKNQSTFVADADGGYAMPLVSRGIIVKALRPGQVYDMSNCPWVIPEHIWQVLLTHRADLP
jgi:hypothetical protein